MVSSDEGEGDIRADDVVVDDTYRDAGYGVATCDAVGAIRFLATPTVTRLKGKRLERIDGFGDDDTGG